ncbi:MAG: hypothetical protein WAL69_01485 [Candidatus Acidiferrales bacterium]
MQLTKSQGISASACSPLVYSPGVTYPKAMNEIVFEVTQEVDGECLSEPIFTQADNWEALRKNVKEAVSAFFFDRKPV